MIRFNEGQRQRESEQSRAQSASREITFTGFQRNSGCVSTRLAWVDVCRPRIIDRADLAMARAKACQARQSARARRPSEINVRIRRVGRGVQPRSANHCVIRPKKIAHRLMGNRGNSGVMMIHLRDVSSPWG